METVPYIYIYGSMQFRKTTQKITQKHMMHGGYVEADNVNDEGMMEDMQPQRRPQRIRRPPDRYGIYVEH